MIAQAEPECTSPLDVFVVGCPCCEACCAPFVPSGFTVMITNGNTSHQGDVFVGTAEEVAARIAEIAAKGVAEMEARGKS